MKLVLSCIKAYTLEPGEYEDYIRLGRPNARASSSRKDVDRPLGRARRQKSLFLLAA